ncbi:EamA family transporter RarD [Gammaproteobacteria bacterium AB-CW1]|uniref:EamA family transporter RarD n=1 Tax=Natronospira elongata TaxID=3110268 RepID=A0AAP6JEI5_9GAMM|nr:EamA family transporter RarD [Gammaproteobacteria bacterium AB-CW1]
MFRSSEEKAGVIFATATFIFYGLTPIYFKAVQHVPALEVLGHRIAWSVVFLFLLIAWWGGLRRGLAGLWRRDVLPWLLLSGAIIGFNWGVFIWTVHADRVMEASLGYYINPLVNVLLGLVFLGERLRPVQWLAVLMAAAGTLNLVLAQGVMPWASFALALSFGFYGLVRKRVEVRAASGLLVETLLLLPAVLLLALWAWQAGELRFLQVDWRTDLLLVAAGVITTLPLIWFANAARRLPLSALGFFQYIAPTVTLCLAVFVFGELFTAAHGITFGLIWAALILLMADTIRSRRKRSAPLSD